MGEATNVSKTLLRLILVISDSASIPVQRTITPPKSKSRILGLAKDVFCMLSRELRGFWGRRFDVVGDAILKLCKVFDKHSDQFLGLLIIGLAIRPRTAGIE